MMKAGMDQIGPESGGRISSRIKNQDGASLMAALLFFVLCGVGASIVLAAASASAGKIRQLPGEDQKRYAVDSAAAFVRDDLLRKENTIKIKEVIVDDSREETPKDTLYCYYVGSAGKPDLEASWKMFYSSEGSWVPESAGIVGAMVKKIYEEHYFMDPSGMNSREETIQGAAIASGGMPEDWREFTLSVKPGGTSMENLDGLRTKVRLRMDENYKITAIISETLTREEKPEERCEKRLVMEPFSTQKRTVDIKVYEPKKDGEDGDGGEGEEDSDGEDDSYTITTTTILTTISWQKGTIEKELLNPHESN